MEELPAPFLSLSQHFKDTALLPGFSLYSPHLRDIAGWRMGGMDRWNRGIVK